MSPRPTQALTDPSAATGPEGARRWRNALQRLQRDTSLTVDAPEELLDLDASLAPRFPEHGVRPGELVVAVSADGTTPVVFDSWSPAEREATALPGYCAPENMGYARQIARLCALADEVGVEVPEATRERVVALAPRAALLAERAALDAHHRAGRRAAQLDWDRRQLELEAADERDTSAERPAAVPTSGEPQRDTFASEVPAPQRDTFPDPSTRSQRDTFPAHLTEAASPERDTSARYASEAARGDGTEAARGDGTEASAPERDTSPPRPEWFHPEYRLHYFPVDDPGAAVPCYGTHREGPCGCALDRARQVVVPLRLAARHAPTEGDAPPDRTGPRVLVCPACGQPAAEYVAADREEVWTGPLALAAHLALEHGMGRDDALRTAEGLALLPDPEPCPSCGLPMLPVTDPSRSGRLLGWVCRRGAEHGLEALGRVADLSQARRARVNADALRRLEAAGASLEPAYPSLAHLDRALEHAYGLEPGTTTRWPAWPETDDRETPPTPRPSRLGRALRRITRRRPPEIA